MSSPSRATPPPGGTVVPAERPLHRAWKHRAPPPAAPDGTSATEVLRWPFQGPDAARSKKDFSLCQFNRRSTLRRETWFSNVFECFRDLGIKFSSQNLTFRISQVLYTFRCHRHPRIWATCGLGGLQHLRHPRSSKILELLRDWNWVGSDTVFICTSHESLASSVALSI